MLNHKLMNVNRKINNMKTLSISKRAAVGVYGTPGGLAKAVGYTPQAISKWPDYLNYEQTSLVILSVVFNKGLRLAVAYFPEIMNDDVPATA